MSASKSITNDLTGGSVARQLLTFSWPIMVTNLLQTVYSLVDMVVVGHFLGSTGLSAVGIGGQIITLFLSVGMSIGHAGQILIAQQVGSKDREGLGYSVGTIAYVEVITGFLLSACCILFCQPILALMNTPAEAHSEASAYVLVCGLGMIFSCGYNAAGSVLRGLGDSRLPMISIGIAQVLNVILDLLFVAGMGMGAGGAALATIIGQAVALTVTVICLLRKKERLGFVCSRKHLRLRRKNLAVLGKLGLPLLLQGLLITLSMTYINSMVNAYGVTASAVDAVGSKINNILYIGIDGIAVGASAMVAQSFGARDFERIRKIHRFSLVFAVAFSAFLCLILMCFPRQIFLLFTTDIQVVDMAPKYMLVVVVYSFAAATMLASFSVVEGVGYTSYAMIISLADGVLARIGLGWLMGQMFGLYGFWFGSACAGFVTTVLAGAYYLSGQWMKRRPLIEAESSASIQQ